MAWRNDLVSSFIFGKQLINHNFDPTASESLARAHIKQTTRRVLSEAQHGHLLHHLPKRDISPAIISLCSALVVIILAVIIAPDWVVSSVLGSPEKQLVSTKPSLKKRPLVGTMTIRYTYPSYTRLGKHQDFFTTGSIKGIQGTDVAFETLSLFNQKALKSLEMIQVTPKGEQARALDVGPDLRVTGRFVLQQSGAYYFRATLKDGRTFEEPTRRTITVMPDKKPRVNVLSHKGRIEVSPQDILEIRYAVEDDFGLTAIQKTHQFSTSEGNPTRKNLDIPSLQSSPRQHQGVFKLDLSTWDLQPKDSVVFILEATDNNTLTGPGIGKSEPIVFVVSSPEDKHLKNIEDQQNIVEELLGVLADFLESPVGKRVKRNDETYVQQVEPQTNVEQFGPRLTAIQKAQKPLGDVLKKMGELTTRLKEDPLMVPRDLAMFEALYIQLNELYQAGSGQIGKANDLLKRNTLALGNMQQVATYAGDMEAALEKGILRLEALLSSQKMDSIQATTKEIRDLKERLKGLLKKYQKTKDPELKKTIKREVQRLRQRMAELMTRLQSQAKRLPQEHVNMEALKNAQMEQDTTKMINNFQSIEKMLEKDDIDGALKALDDMTANLDNLTKKMDDQKGNTGSEKLREFDKKVSELMDDVNDLSAMQKEVEKQTEALQKQMQAEQKKETSQQLDKITKSLLQKVQKQKKELNALNTKNIAAPNQAAISRMKDRADRLEKTLKQKDIDQSLKEAKSFLNEMESLRFSMQMSQRYVRRPSKRYDRLKENIRKIRPMNKRGEEIVDDLQSLMDNAQVQQDEQAKDPRAKKLAEQQGKIQERAKKLEERTNESAKKFPSLKQKLEGDLKKAQQAMKDAKDGLGKRKMQRALDGERQSLESLEKLKESMKQALKNKRKNDGKKEGKKNDGRQKVEIPGQAENENKSYRETIKKGMKEERLKDYASDIESYYKSLVE